MLWPSDERKEKQLLRSIVFHEFRGITENWHVTRDSNPIPGIQNPGSQRIFSIPNPGIGAAVIPGFRKYEKWTKYPNFTWYLPEKILFLNFGGHCADSTQTPTTSSWWTSFYGRKYINCICASLRYFTVLALMHTHVTLWQKNANLAI